MSQDSEKSKVAFTEFGGWSPNADRRDIGLLAFILTNFTLNVPGQLTSRLGHTEASFANEQASVNYAVIAMTRYETPSYTYAIYETLDGNIRAGRTPS